MASRDDKVISQDGLTKVRLALYNAKLALESGFDGEDRVAVIRNIVDALDETANLSPPGVTEVMKD